jgi:hypothetical protein
MAIALTATVTVNDGLSSPLTGSYSITDADGMIVLDVDLTANQTNKEVDAAFALAGLRHFSVESQSLAVTVKTNSTSAPDDTFSVPIGGCVQWTEGMPDEVNPLQNEDVTKLYLTNATNAVGTVRLRILPDLTP